MWEGPWGTHLPEQNLSRKRLCLQGLVMVINSGKPRKRTDVGMTLFDIILCGTPLFSGTRPVPFQKCIGWETCVWWPSFSLSYLVQRAGRCWGWSGVGLATGPPLELFPPLRGSFSVPPITSLQYPLWVLCPAFVLGASRAVTCLLFPNSSPNKQMMGKRSISYQISLNR